MATLSLNGVISRLARAFPASLQNTALYQLFAQIYTDVTAVEDRVTAIEGGVVNCTDSTLTITAATHANRIVTLNRAAGIAVTLPAATGSGNRYTFIVGTTFTSNGTIKVVGDDIMVGHAILAQDSADTVVQFGTASDSDTITFYTAANNTTGGIKGAKVELIDMAADTWHVVYISEAGGTEASPFSATVTP